MFSTTKSEIETRCGSSRTKLPRIRDALGSTPLWKKDPQERESRSITPVPFFLLLPHPPPSSFSLTLSLSAENYEGPTRSGCVNDQSWPARARAPGPDAVRAARAGGCHVRIYISDFLFMQLFVRESWERVSRSRRYPPSRPPCPPDAAVRRPSSPSADSHVEVRVCVRGGTCSFSYTPAPSAWVSFWYSFGVSSRRGDTFGEEEVGYGTRARCEPIGRPVKRIPIAHALMKYFRRLSSLPPLLFRCAPAFSFPLHWWIVTSADTSVRAAPTRRIIIYMLRREDLRAGLFFAVRI